MGNGFKTYLLIWALLAGMYNFLFFMIGNFTPAGFYMAGYAIVMAAFVIQLLCGAVAFRKKTLKEMIYYLPVIRAGTIGLICTFAVSIFFAVWKWLPSWIGITCLIIITVVTLIRILIFKSGADYIAAADEETAGKTAFMKDMALRSELLWKNETDADARRAAEKVHEAFRYSDPVSDPRLAWVEEELYGCYLDFEKSIREKNAARYTENCNSLLTKIRERNALVLRYKSV